MAERAATIRSKLVGIDEVRSQFDLLNREIAKNQREQARLKEIYAKTDNAADKRHAAEGLIQLANQRRVLEASERKEREKVREANYVAEQQSLIRSVEKEGQAREKLATRVQWQQYQVEQAGLKLREKVTDRTVALHARERESLVRNLGAVDAVRERSARRGGRQDMEGALSGFGGKMVLGQAVGGMMANMANAPELGQAVGSSVSAFMFGGSKIGAAVVGMEAIGIGFRIVRERAIAASQATAQYHATLSQFQGAWSQLATSSIESTPFGNAMVKQVEAAREVVAKAMQDAVAARQQGWRWGLRDIEIRGATERADLAQQQEESAARFRDAEYPKRLAFERRVLEAQKGIYAVTTMRPGLLKEERMLTAKIAADDEKRLAGQQLRRDQAWAGYQQARDLYEKERDRMDARPKTEEEIAARQVQLEQMQKRVNDAADAYNRLNGEEAQENAAATAAQNQELGQQQVRYQEALREQTNQTAAAKVAAETRGYRQTVALQEEAFRVQLDNARQNGAAMVALTEEQQRHMRTVRQREAREGLEDRMAGWSPRMAQRAFLRRMEDAEAQGREAGMRPDELAAMKKEELTGQYRRQTEEARLEIAVKRRKMTMKEADIARMMLDNPLARVAGPEGDAVRKAIAENAEAQDALRWRPRSPGQFSTRYQAGFVDTSVLDQTPRRDAMTIAREQLQIDKLISDTLLRIEKRGSMD